MDTRVIDDVIADWDRYPRITGMLGSPSSGMCLVGKVNFAALGQAIDAVLSPAFVRVRRRDAVLAAIYEVLLDWYPDGWWIPPVDFAPLPRNRVIHFNDARPGVAEGHELRDTSEEAVRNDREVRAVVGEAWRRLHGLSPVRWDPHGSPPPVAQPVDFTETLADFTEAVPELV